MSAFWFFKSLALISSLGNWRGVHTSLSERNLRLSLIAPDETSPWFCYAKSVPILTKERDVR